MKRRTDHAFTLIELLVVISIIGLLSSVVMASLGSARLKAKDAAIRQQMLQLKYLYESSYASKGNYFDWQFNITAVGGCGYAPSSSDPDNNFTYYCVSSGATCTSMFMSAINSPSPEAEKICNGILNSIGSSRIDGAPAGDATFGMAQAYSVPGGTKQHYSFAAFLPGKRTYLCIGDHGMSDTSSVYPFGFSTYYDASMPLGCSQNP